jgi:ligand-binding sensor protein
MDVYDMRSKEEWQKTLDHVFRELDMPAALLDNKNIILQTSGERNALCLAIRSNNEALPLICGQTQQTMAKQAETTKAPVIDACNAGLSKFVIPLFVADEWVGSFTACGSSIPYEDIEDFIIGQSTKMSEKDIGRLKQQVSPIQQAKVIEVVDRLFQELSP